MISAGEALSLEQTRGEKSPIELAKLTEREETQLLYLDAMVESSFYKSYAGGAFGVRLPGYLVEPHVVEHLKRLYEEGGWLVGVFKVGPSPKEGEYLLTFSPAGNIEIRSAEVWPPKTMPRPVASLTVGGFNHRLLVRMPTRQRPVQALAALQKYREMAGAPITIEVIVDEDDETMLAADVLQRLAALQCVVTAGRHKSKVEACNAGKVQDWDILVLASDDMVPVKDGWALRVIEEMERAWPHFDGAIFFNDGYQRSNLCTLPIFGRRLYDQFGYIYAPEYKSLFCDREQTDVLQALGRLKYVDEKIIEHRHHVWNRAEKDALYERNDALESVDKMTFERRKHTRCAYSQFAFDAPPLWLSILICTVPDRQHLVERLLADLWSQIEAIRSMAFDWDPRMVEILVDNRIESSVGAKRQALLETARGHYVAFIDDDDGVAHDYVRRVLLGTALDLTYDCASLVGVITENGGRPATFKHSIEYDGWYTKDGVHYRTPNHLNAIRRDLALQVGFVAKNVGEDYDFSTRIRPLLKKEASTGDAPLYYYWFNASNSVQAKK